MMFNKQINETSKGKDNESRKLFKNTHIAELNWKKKEQIEVFLDTND